MIIEGFIAVYIGLCVGSFATMLSHRIPRGEDIIVTRSHCPKCQHKLGFRDLFPVFSWLLAHGKCRYCHARIGVVYPLIEVAVALLFLAIFLLYGVSWHTALLWAVVTCLVVITSIDLQHYIIPDSLNLALAVLGVLYAWSTHMPFFPVILTAIGGAFFGVALGALGKWWKKQDALGWGDIKFLAVSGLYIGPDAEAIARYFFIAGVGGIILALCWRMLGKGERFPFGPSLALALLGSIVL